MKKEKERVRIKKSSKVKGDTDQEPEETLLNKTFDPSFSKSKT